MDDTLLWSASIFLSIISLFISILSLMMVTKLFRLQNLSAQRKDIAEILYPDENDFSIALLGRDYYEKRFENINDQLTAIQTDALATLTGIYFDYTKCRVKYGSKGTCRCICPPMDNAWPKDKKAAAKYAIDYAKRQKEALKTVCRKGTK